MTEIHCDPDHAWSDAQQQITPQAYAQLVSELVFKRDTTDDQEFIARLESIRQKMDEVDGQMLDLLAQRMKLSESIGIHKKQKNISIFQLNRWNEILEKAKAFGKKHGMSENFITHFMNAVHQESINRQSQASETEIE